MRLAVSVSHPFNLSPSHTSSLSLSIKMPFSPHYACMVCVPLFSLSVVINDSVTADL